MTSLRVWRGAESTGDRVLLGCPPPPTGHSQIAMGVEPGKTELRAQIDRQQAQIAALNDQLLAARQAAEHLRDPLTALQKDLEGAHREAQERGLAEGTATAQREMRQHLEALSAGWQSSAEDMLRQNEKRLNALRAELTDIVLAAVSKILGDHLAHPQMVRMSTEQLLKESGINAPLRVLLAPAQHEQLMKAGGAQLAWFRDRHLELAADARVQFGGCLLETERGVIDGRFEVQLEKLRELVASHFGSVAR